MPRRSKISQLPSGIKAWLQQTLRDSGFSGYAELTDELNDRIRQHGLDQTISKTGLHEFGQAFQREIEQMQRDARASAYLVQVLGDDQDTVSRANILLAQSSIQRLLLQAEERGLEPKELGALVRATADAARAGITQAKWQDEVKRKTADAADAVEGELQATTLSPDTLQRIREQIYGIAA